MNHILQPSNIIVNFMENKPDSTNPVIMNSPLAICYIGLNCNTIGTSINKVSVNVEVYVYGLIYYKNLTQLV